MTILPIGAAELAALRAGMPMVVAAAGMDLPEGLSLAILRPVDGALRLADGAPGPAHPFPAGLRPLAALAPDPASGATLAEGLPPGTPLLTGPMAMAGLASLLAEALARSESTRAALHRRLDGHPPSLPRRVLDLPPRPGTAPPPPRIAQPLGRPAEGISGIALHLATGATDPASLLRVRLVAGGRIACAWTVPSAALSPGWLALDLPEPLPPGPAEALLEVALEAAAGDAVALSAGATDPAAPLALRIEEAPPGHRAAPLHCDWAAWDMPAPESGATLPLAEGAWDAARVTGARAERIAAGTEAPRLLIALEPGTEAVLDLPALPCGPAELALLCCRLPVGEAGGAEVQLSAWPAMDEAAVRHSLWRGFDAEGALRIGLPLPPAPCGAIRLRLRVRSGGAAAMVEVERLALGMGLAGDRRRAPPEVAAAPAVPVRISPGVPVPAAPVGAGRLSVALPGAGPAQPRGGMGVFAGGAGAERAAFRITPPQPRLAGGDAGAPAAVAAPAPALRHADASAAFQDLTLQQHLVNAEGTYRHLDLAVTGLVAAAGLWRHVRLKLFDRRGTAGLEFRAMTGWPQMFDVWPGARQDNYGPFWRVESDAPAEALRQLTTPHDWALILAVLDVLPALARRGAMAASLAQQEQEAWTERARILAAAVAASREGPRG